MPVASGTPSESEIDFSDLEDKYYVQEEEGFGTIIVIDNLPVVDEKKVARLTDVLKKLIVKIGVKGNAEIFMPIKEETLGYAFVTLDTLTEATAVVKALDNHRMDKSHVFSVNFFDDVEMFAEIDDEYKEPEIEEFVEKEHLKSWLMDPNGRDHFVQLAGDHVGIYWNNKKEEPELVHGRPKWSEFFVQWSPLGSYLTTFHRQGAQAWGGENWQRLARFPHPNVKLVDFSPNENYVVTWSVDPVEFEPGESHNIAVWNANTGARLRTFPFDRSSLVEPQEASNGLNQKSPVQSVKMHWPLFKWSHDDKYLARITPTGISVYETPSMGLLNKTSIKIANVQAIEWSPTDHILSFWTPELGNIPARVTLMEIPSRNIVRTKNLFNVTDCKLFWQSGGTYLLVKVDLIRTKKQTGSNFELFRVKERNVPIDVMEIKTGEVVTQVVWEPNGDRFVVTVNEGPKSHGYFYEMVSLNATDTVEAIKLLKTLDAKGINRISWSPSGRFLVLASLGPSGSFEFWDMDELLVMGNGEHYMSTDLEWDPTGRYVVSFVSFWQVQSDNGFAVWSFTGQQLYRVQIPQFKQFLWRNLPKSLLSKEQQQSVRKNLKEFSKEFDEIDNANKNKASKEVVDRRNALWHEWTEFRRKCAEEFKQCGFR